jgi:hypothetical protein
VEPVAGGYRIVSPCCSRNIDQAVGLIDIARIEWEAGVEALQPEPWMPAVADADASRPPRPADRLPQRGYPAGVLAIILYRSKVMKVMISKNAAGALTACVAKNDLEESIVAMEKPEM